jgi:hypothetical protein
VTVIRSPLAMVGLCTAAVVTLQFREPLHAQRESDLPALLTDLIKAFDERQAQLEVCWVKYKTEHYESLGWQQALGNIISKPDLRYTSEVEFASKGAKKRSYSAPTPRQRKEYLYIFNGELSVKPAIGDHVFAVSREHDATIAPESPLSYTGELPLYKGLKQVQSGEVKLTKFVTRGRENDALVFEIHYGTGWRNKCWILPDRSYSLRRYEVYTPKGLTSVSEANDFFESDGIVYPKSGRRKNYGVDSALGATFEFEVTHFETKPSRILDSLFEYDLPKGAAVWDSDNKTYVRNAGAVQTHLDAALSRLGQQPHRWHRWLWWVVPPVLISLAALVVLRRRRAGA